MAEVITETNFNLPGQVGDVYRGKVGDVYSLDSDLGDLLAVVRTDRISAFDVVLPRAIPHKGQVLNQMSANLLAAAEVAAPNWLIEVPDPNVSIGYRAQPFRVEMIMRGFLLGTSWRSYREGRRDLCGNELPDGMREFQAFDSPLLTPTTKADAGHDENITPTEIVETGLASPAEYDEMARLSFALFAQGQAMARERGLVLADTKYEFGRLATGEIVVIDEAHTPDSSRYFSSDEYRAYLQEVTDTRPEQLSKEFVREWLVAQGFSGQEGQTPPDMPDEFVNTVSQRYMNLYRTMLGKPFEIPSSDGAVSDRIASNILESLERLGA